MINTTSSPRAVIRSAYIEAFEERHSQVRESILDPSLTILSAVSNVLTHSAGYVDKKFMEVYAAFQPLRTTFPQATLDERLVLTDGQFEAIIVEPTLLASRSLIEGVCAAIEQPMSPAEDAK